MKATNANQRIARELAGNRAYDKTVNWQKVRAENARRAARATGKLRVVEPDHTWLMHDICSTPYATVRT